MSGVENWFGPGVAERYDVPDDPMFDPDLLRTTTEFLAGHARGGRVLEFAIGTGRVALPLAARGVPVAGVELSEEMLAELARKPGAENIEVHVGDMATTCVPGEFDLVFLVFNTINNLVSQDAQVACFENAARHLRPGGRFVVEVGVPQLQRLPVGERFVPFSVDHDHLGIDEYDPVEQGLISHHYSRRGDGAGLVPRSVPFRYVWPAELDLMARIAGMTRLERWASWDRSPFTATSPSHVSVWHKRS